jgi:PelA/Pel-15E family pectate lyase
MTIVHCRLLSLLLLMGFTLPGQARPVKLTEVTWHGTGCYMIEMSMGTVYFEKDNGVSGFKSFLDPDGNDWIASYLPPGPNGDFRGFPNSPGNFGHAGRDSGSTTFVVDGKTEGDCVILESSNAEFSFQYWFFADRIAVKVLRSKGDYCFLLECVAGGSADAEDYFVTADGTKHTPSGALAQFKPKWITIGDPKARHVMFFGKTPDDEAPNENHRQIRPSGLHNMDLYSFGRTGREQGYQIRGMSGNDHVCVIGFTSASRDHDDIARMMDRFLGDPFARSGGGSTAFARWSTAYLRRPAEWYSSAEARAVAEVVVQYQSAEGGWPKNRDLTVPPLAPAELPGSGANTLDNGAFLPPVQFLATLAEATGSGYYRNAVERSIDYLFAAQYANGGFPQYYPLRPGYYSRITYNDGAMIEALTVLRDVAEGRAPYRFVDQTRRKQAAAALAKGIECILRTQIIQEGKPTVWCAQHDEETLAPAWARNYEPPSLSGSESVGIVRFLMAIERPTPEIVAAIEGAVVWFRSVSISGFRTESVRREDGRLERMLVPDGSAAPFWARFYELRTNRPLYVDRDSIFRYDFNRLSYERRSGYGYNGTWPADLLQRDYPAWRAKHSLPAR